MPANSKYFDPSRVQVAHKRRKKNIWEILLPWAYACIFILLIVLAAGVFWPVLNRNQELNQQKILLTQRIEEAKAVSLKLQQENTALQSDPWYVERKARDLLNVGRKGEIIFKFPPYGSNKLR